MSQAQAKALALHAKAASAPTEEQLAAIRAHTLRDFTADEIVVREYLLAHNAIDRDRECFAPSLLDDFARTLPGKGVFAAGHPSDYRSTGGPAEGKVFAATTERMSFDAAKLALREPRLVFPPDATDAVLLKVSAYFVRTPDNDSFLRKLDAGIGCDVSIGFRGGALDRLKDANGMELNAWRWNGPGEALELSHVWLGAQPGARAVKSASRNPEEPTMDHAKQIADLTAERDQQKAAAEANAKAATTLTALAKALGADAALLDQPAQLAAQITDGRAFRNSLVDDLVATERHMGITGDTAEDVAASKSLYDALPTEKLVAMKAALEKRAGTTPQAKPGDPNAGKPGAGTKAVEGSPISNPLLA